MMNLSERFKNWRTREAEKLRGMTFSKKLGYLFTYYKGWLAGFLVIVLFLGYGVDVVVQGQKEVVLQGFFTNDEYDLFPAGQLQKDVAAHLSLEKNQRVIFDDGLYVDLHGEATEYTAASNGKIIAYMTTGELDFVITSKEVYEHFAEEVPLRDLSALLPAPLYEELSPYIVCAPNPTEDGEDIPGGIELSRSRFLRDAGLEEGSYYLFVPYSAPHPEALCEFIRYCFA